MILLKNRLLNMCLFTYLLPFCIGILYLDRYRLACIVTNVCSTHNVCGWSRRWVSGSSSKRGRRKESCQAMTISHECGLMLQMPVGEGTCIQQLQSKYNCTLLLYMLCRHFHFHDSESNELEITPFFTYSLINPVL